MNYIIDTHVVIDLINKTPRLSHNSLSIIDKRENNIYLSLASFWEIAIKVRIGKLVLPFPFYELASRISTAYNIIPLPIQLDHFIAVSDMPLYHADPFDRLIISQSMATTYPVITADKEFNKYAIKVLN